MLVKMIFPLLTEIKMSRLRGRVFSAFLKCSQMSGMFYQNPLQSCNKVDKSRQVHLQNLT